MRLRVTRLQHGMQLGELVGVERGVLARRNRAGADRFGQVLGGRVPVERDRCQRRHLDLARALAPGVDHHGQYQYQQQGEQAQQEALDHDQTIRVKRTRVS